MSHDLECLCDQIRCMSKLDDATANALIVKLLCQISGNTEPPIAVEDIDIQTVCASTDGRLLLLTVNHDTGTTTLTELDGSPITDGATAINCDVEYKWFESCFREIGNPEVTYTRVVCLQVGSTDSEIFWLDASGQVVPAPANVEPCVDLEPCQPAGEVCYMDNGEVKKAIRMVQKQLDGSFEISFIDSLTGSVVSTGDVVDCPEPMITSIKNCVL